MLELAIRNLRRHRRRTWFTAGTVVFALWIANLSVAIFRDLFSRLVDAGTRAGPGEATVTAPGPYELLGVGDHIDFAAIVARLGDMDPPLRIMPRITSFGTVASAKTSTGAAFLALDPQRETVKNNLILGSLTSGSQLTGKDRRGCLLGSALAKHLQLQLGSKIVITTASAQGQMLAHAATVQGIFTTHNAEIDQHLVILGLQAMQDLLGLSVGGATQVALFSDAGHPRANARLADIKARLSDLKVTVRPWQETLPDLAGYILADEVSGGLSLAFIGGIVFASLLNTMMMSVVERRREFGVMLALGMQRRDLVILIATEAALIGLLGTVIGALTVSPFAYYLHRHGIDLSGLFSDGLNLGGFGVAVVLGYEFKAVDVIVVVGALVFINVAATIWPAVRAAQTQPITALRQH